MTKQTPGGGVAEKVRPKTRVQKPPLFKVILHNDDYTTMEFVIDVLEHVFDKPHAEAHALMLRVHLHGAALVGAYTHEIAETKVERVHEEARQAGYPLRASMEEE